MSRPKGLKRLNTTEELILNNLLNKSFPDINPKEGEELNINKAILKILKYCWYNIDRFKTIDDISKEVGLSPGKISIYCRRHGFTTREQLFKEKKREEDVVAWSSLLKKIGELESLAED